MKQFTFLLFTAIFFTSVARADTAIPTTIGAQLKSIKSFDLKNLYPDSMLFDQGKLLFTDVNEGTGTLNFLDLSTGAIESVQAGSGCVFKVGDRQAGCGPHSIVRYQNLILLPSGENGLGFFDTATKITSYLNLANETIYSVDVLNHLAYAVSREGHIFIYDLELQKLLETLTLPSGYIARDIKVGTDGVMQLIVYNIQEGDHHLTHPTIALFDSVKGGINILDAVYHPYHLNYSNNKMEFISVIDEDDAQIDFVQLDGASGQMNLRQILPFEDESINWMELTSTATDRYFFISVSYQKPGDHFTSSAIQVFDLLAK